MPQSIKFCTPLQTFSLLKVILSLNTPQCIESERHRPDAAVKVITSRLALTLKHPTSFCLWCLWCNLMLLQSSTCCICFTAQFVRFYKSTTPLIAVMLFVKATERRNYSLVARVFVAREKAVQPFFGCFFPTNRLLRRST